MSIHKFLGSKSIRKVVKERPGSVVIGSMHSSEFGVLMPGNKTITASIPKRGVVAEKASKRARTFEIAYNPDVNDLRNGLLAVIREKVINDITAVNFILAQARKEGKGGQSVNDISPDDVLVARKR